MRGFVAMLAVVFPTLALGAEDFPCPPMPAAITDVNRNFKTDISATAGSIGKVKAAEIGAKVDIEAENLFSKYPNADRIFTLQMLLSTYCGMIRSSALPVPEKLTRWDTFQNRVLDMMTEDPRRPAQRPSAPTSGAIQSTPQHIGKPTGSKEPEPDAVPAKERADAPITLEDYVRLIKTADAGKKRELKSAARKLVAEDFNFGRVEATDDLKHYRSFNFVSYDPARNILVIDEKYEYKDPPSCKPKCPTYVGRLTIDLGRVDRIATFSGGQFDLDCWYSAQYGRNKCISFTTEEFTCTVSRCQSGSDQVVSFYIPNNAKIRRLQSALQAVIYKIDGRPAI